MAQRSYEQASKEMMGRFGYSPEGNAGHPAVTAAAGRGGGGTPLSGNVCAVRARALAGQGRIWVI